MGQRLHDAHVAVKIIFIENGYTMEFTAEAVGTKYEPVCVELERDSSMRKGGSGGKIHIETANPLRITRRLVDDLPPGAVEEIDAWLASKRETMMKKAKKVHDGGGQIEVTSTGVVRGAK